LAFATKRRVYVDDPSDAPPGAQLITGPLGGIYWENNAPPGRVTRGGIAGEGGPDKPGGGPAKPAGGGGGSAKKPAGGGVAKKPPAAKREPGKPFKDANDASLPERVKKEPPERRELFVRTFNAILEAGGGEIDAARLAIEKLGEPAKRQAEAKRQAAQQKRQAEAERRRQQAAQRTARKSTMDLGGVRTAMNLLPDEFLSDAGRMAKAAAVAALDEAEKAGPTKTEGGRQYGAGDFADVPDPTKPSTWKLRLGDKPEAPDVVHIAAAITALSPGGFRGNVVQLGSPKDRVIARINAAIGKLDDDAQKRNLRTRLGKVKSMTIPDDDSCPHGYALDEKCDECGPAMAMPPFGGATSFDELDAFIESRELSQEINELSYQFRVLVDNTMGAMMMDPKEKAAAVAKAASDFHSRVMALPEGEEKDALLDDSIEAFEIAGRQISAAAKEGKRIGRPQVGMLKRMFEDLKSLLGWASYEDGEPAAEKVLAEGGGLQIYEKDGVVRWLTYSSNAFEDIEGELFSTKSLEDAVAWADAVGERGPLRLFHVPGADVGHCDYQAVFGRFLVESGTFADTPIGRKAKDYFLHNRDKRFGVSIGYLYRQGDELDGTYDWLRIRERSVTPEGMAANPWTEFTVGGDVMTDARKAAFLEEILGKDAATTIISEAERRTKELEPLVRHKAAGDPDPTVASTDPPKPAAVAVVAAADPEGEDEQAKEMAAAIAGLKDLVTSLAGVPAAIAALEKDVADLKKTDDEKVAALLAPRARVAAEAASAKAGNVPGDELVELVTGGGKEAPGASPVSVYVQDLMRQNGVPVS